MANVSLARGLFPLRPYRRVTYYKANTASDLFLYQPSALDANGLITFADGGSGGAILGSIVGFADKNGGHLKRDLPYMKTTDGDGAQLVAVTDHPEQEYLMEEDTGGSALSATHVGNLTAFGYLGTTGDTVTGFARAVIDRSTVSTGSGALILVGLHREAGTENAYGDYAKWVVRIRDYQWGSVYPAAGI